MDTYNSRWQIKINQRQNNSLSRFNHGIFALAYFPLMTLEIIQLCNMKLLPERNDLFSIRRKMGIFILTTTTTPHTYNTSYHPSMPLVLPSSTIKSLFYPLHSMTPLHPVFASWSLLPPHFLLLLDACQTFLQ